MHRSAAIVGALDEGGDIARRLADQRVSVVLIPYHKPDEVRQLFADLNRNAKPVSQTVALNYEIRDPVVILSKRLASEIPLFDDRVNMTSNSLAPKSPYVIALNTMVTANTVLLAAMLNTKPKLVTKHAEMVKLRSLQPSDDAVTGYASRLAEVWNAVIGAIPQWQGVTDKKVKPGELRGEGMQGYVFAFDLGWQALAQAAAALIIHRPQTWKTDLVKAIQAVDWRKGPHWNGIAMVGERVNNTGPGIQATTGYVLRQAGLTAEDGTDIKDLLEALGRSEAGQAKAA
jgi:DNA sulfur modification protein DndB